LYFPVSALMTLFGNIIQNPLDPRAKSDTRLMNLVVNFLSMLGQEAETGGVHRMLGVCSEFERIAKKVIEKAETEQSSRRKRKNHDSTTEVKPSTTSTAASRPKSSGATPTAHHGTPGGMSMSSHMSPPSADMSDRSSCRSSLAPMNAKVANEPSPGLPSAGWPQEFAVPDGDFTFADLPGGFPPQQSGVPSPHMGMGGAAPFQQPLLPPDLFALPMSFDWEFAEMSGGAYPSVENGNFGDGGGGRL
jgi:hypothetical protein